MKKRRLQAGVVLLIGIAAAFQSISPSQVTGGKTIDTADYRAMIEEYCAGCHNKDLKTAGISLEGLDFDKVGGDADVWEKVLRKVRTGQMPPSGMPHPNAPTVSAFVSWLEGSLDRAAEADPNPGRPAPHRLNRAEYSNAIRDLLAVDINPGSSLPVDDSGYGFDNIGEVLTLSPALLEKYMSAARRVSRLAIGDITIKPGEEQFQPRRDPPGTVSNSRTRGERVSDDLPFYSRGGLSFQHYFPLDAEYLIRIRSNRSFHDMQLAVKAGMHTVGVTFPRSDAKPEPAVPGPGRFAPPAMAAPQKVPMDLRLDGARIKRFDVSENTGTDLVLIRGPFNATGRGETAGRAKIFICHPASAKDEIPCARKILTKLTRRAFRRPVTDIDVNPLLAFYERGRREGDFDYGIQSAIEAMLVSPDFLFRIERDPRTATPSGIYRLSDFDLASRLSFFLWSSIPDDQLLDLAERRKLSDPAVLQQQIHRMLDDPRSQAFVDNFGGQWLHLRNLEIAKPDPDRFPTFDEGLRQAFRRETELFFESILRENRSIFDLIEANYTFVNQRLAEHYDIKGIYGSQFRRVELNDPNRGGLLGQGSILTVTSYPNRTSIVLRGKWVLENLLGAPPPPPPPDIPDLKPHGKDGRQLTMREQMESHRVNPVCASCHARMDPIGFSLENYDGTGRWRTKDAGAVIDASGKMPDGTKFSGPLGLKKLLLSGHRDEFATTVTEKLLTYALGRGLEAYDKPSVRAIIKEAAQDDYRLQALITSIIKSRPFQMRKSSEKSGVRGPESGVKSQADRLRTPDTRLRTLK
jgi:mono/diheme cytochrome c family protein